MWLSVTVFIVIIIVWEKWDTVCCLFGFLLVFYLTCWGNASKFQSIIEWRFCPLGQTVARQNSIGTVLLPLTFQGMHFVDTKTARHTLTLLPRTKRNGSTITDNTRRATLEFKQGQNVRQSRNTIWLVIWGSREHALVIISSLISCSLSKLALKCHSILSKWGINGT